MALPRFPPQHLKRCHKLVRYRLGLPQLCSQAHWSLRDKPLWLRGFGLDDFFCWSSVRAALLAFWTLSDTHASAPPVFGHNHICSARLLPRSISDVRLLRARGFGFVRMRREACNGTFTSRVDEIMAFNHTLTVHLHLSTHLRECRHRKGSVSKPREAFELTEACFLPLTHSWTQNERFAGSPYAFSSRTYLTYSL